MSKDGTVVSTNVGDIKPQGLLHALSEIEQFSVAERASPIPEEAVTTINILSFFTVGIKIGCVSVLVTSLLSPFSFAAHENVLPVFGSYAPSMLDRAFVFLLSMAFSAGCAFLIFALLSKLYFGNVTRRCAGTLVGGYVAGSVFSSVLVFILYHIVYFKYLAPEPLAELLSYIPEGIRPSTTTYIWLARFTAGLIPASYFQAFIALISMLIVSLSIVVSRIKTRREKEMEEIWE